MDHASGAIFQAVFLFTALKLGDDGSLNKGSCPGPSRVQHANKYSNQCLSNVIVNHPSLLPSHGAVILLALDFRLLSQASAALGELPMTAIVLSPLSASLCLIFLKCLAPTFPQHCPFVPGKKWFGEAAESQFQRPQGDILSHLIFIHLWVLIAFFPHFSSTEHPAFSLTGRSILFLIQNAFLLISILQKLWRPLITCWFFSCWLICWPCCSLLPFQPFFPPLSKLRPELTTCCLFSSSLSLSSDRVFPKWLFFFLPTPCSLKKQRELCDGFHRRSVCDCLSESFKSKAKPWLNTQTQLTRGVPPIGRGHNQRVIGRYLLISLVHWQNSIH